MKAPKQPAPPADKRRELLAELARRIASYMGSAENRATDIPGLTLYRRTAPTAPCSMTYEPSVTVIAQGRKRVELGRNIFIYDASRFLVVGLFELSHSAFALTSASAFAYGTMAECESYCKRSVETQC